MSSENMEEPEPIRHKFPFFLQSGIEALRPPKKVITSKLKCEQLEALSQAAFNKPSFVIPDTDTPKPEPMDLEPLDMHKEKVSDVKEEHGFQVINQSYLHSSKLKIRKESNSNANVDQLLDKIFPENLESSKNLENGEIDLSRSVIKSNESIVKHVGCINKNADPVIKNTESVIKNNEAVINNNEIIQNSNQGNIECNRSVIVNNICKDNDIHAEMHSKKLKLDNEIEEKKIEHDKFTKVEKELEEIFSGIPEENKESIVKSVECTTQVQQSDNELEVKRKKTDLKNSNPVIEKSETIKRRPGTVMIINTKSKKSVIVNRDYSPVLCNEKQDTSNADSIFDTESSSEKRDVTTDDDHSKVSDTCDNKWRKNKKHNKRKSKKLKKSNGKTRKSKSPSSEVVDDVKNGTKSRGPYIRILGSVENPTSITIVNSNKDDKETERLLKQAASRPRSASTSEAFFNGTKRSDNELSIADEPWVCTFCKKGPHCEGGLGGKPAGDLFGPYFIKIKKNMDDLDCSIMKQISKAQKGKGNGYACVLKESERDKIVNKEVKKYRKHQKKDTIPEEFEMEVWSHEDCYVWAPGCYLIGDYTLGLKEAVYASLNVKCNYCGLTGAPIGCLVKDCLARTHYGCAVSHHWSLVDFQAKCPKHINFYH